MADAEVKRCQHCGSKLVVARKFCPDCGKPLASKKSGSPELDDFLKSQAAARVALPSKDEIDVRARIKLPPTAVKNVKELIYWEYAKIMAEAAHFEGNYRFIMSRYMKLKKGGVLEPSRGRRKRRPPSRQDVRLLWRNLRPNP
jgi:hypothetical protein